MRIGRVARRYYLGTEAPSKFQGRVVVLRRDHGRTGVPFVACFVAWLGGVVRTGNVLGIHRPFPPTSEMRKLSPTEAERLYNDLSGKVLAYLSEMDAAPHWLSDMMRISSDGRNKLRDELEGDPEHFSWDVPSLAQWKFSRCGGLSAKAL